MVDLEEARYREKSFIENIADAQEHYTWILDNKAWNCLGFGSFADWWQQRIVPVMNALQMRPTREIGMAAASQIREEEKDLPRLQQRSQEQIADAVGVPQQTLNDWSRSSNNRPRYNNDLGRPPAPPRPEPIMLQLRTHDGRTFPYPKPQAKPTFNATDGEGISWAAWSWNPVTGCLHGCEYCYARAIATRWSDAYPAGFTPLFHHERLSAPANTVIPAAHRDDEAWRRVFVCSMADLYGRWVPDEWISQVHESMLASPQWQYILLTKFPNRYPGLQLPPDAWVGTSVDEQKRVRIAENAFREISGVRVKWLSLEPLREPLEFTDLSVFDWIVIGAQTETRQPTGPVAAFAPPFEWVARLVAQAREAGCQVHLKPNLVNGRPGMQLPDEYPGALTT